ncbi:MAG: T9SS type A sorting domain-containing protein [bacterium]
MKIFLHENRDGGRKRRFFLINFFVFLLPLGLMLNGDAEIFAQDCNGSFIAEEVPLTDLGTGKYKGQYEGGLYPGGSNVCPQEHLNAGLAIAKEVQPLNASGQPDPNGKIVMISIGMSNTQQEFEPFIEKALAEPELNPKLVIVNGARSGQHVGKWQNPAATGWGFLADAIAKAGVTAEQVQVAWIKLASRSDVGPQTFPEHATALQDGVKATVQNLKDKYPNTRIAYLSSRIYAGYATIPLSPEPFAYEGGFSMKWLIEEQINGDSSLVYDGANPRAPWLAWGPYLWADGLGSDGVVGGVPGRSDGLEWECGDFQSDGTHPSINVGRFKAAGLLLDFLKQESTALPWFMPNVTTNVELASFQSAVQGSDVVLRWVTTRETNNYGFEVQRKDDLAGFKTIAFVEGHGTSSNRNTYEYLDRRLQPGAYSYRLKQVDFNGQIELSSVLSVQIESPQNFKLDPNYPNPFRSQTTLFYELPERSFVTIKIYNVLGQEIAVLVSKELESGQHSVQWNGLDKNQQPVAAGMYFVTLWKNGQQGNPQLLARRKILNMR